ncbi:ATP-dependent nuclease [Halalkalibacter nanhaiisediminis]|uniref:Putative ATP-dependent endonuclease of OLD family n=1 Tax=Halalkalibacter nanhaiisediminis TaxID=688079 RepID=A0A562QH87_9BACI|nr:AAA family ATPase [Halalkalibacter nanhaiisediminis]TWI56104.1 putative ATP-dependent endonuclease of OLD family [Halalkalibacter nanhaiisediminis]
MRKKVQAPYISKVTIKNFRNFLDTEVILNSKQVIIGENNVGKTNFIKALQLILDPNFSDSDRELEESDFNDSIDSPFESKQKIEISIEIQGFEKHTALLAAFCDGSVCEEPPTIKITYEFAPINDKEYGYSIFLGDNRDLPFTHIHRKLLNIKVINGLRDANNDLKNSKKSPFNKLLKTYEVDKDLLNEIALEMKEKGNVILELEEIEDLSDKLNSNLIKIVGEHVPYSKINLETLDINPNRILNTLKLMVGLNKQRSVPDTSLGVTNILYIALVLLSIEDRTIPSLIKVTDFDELKTADTLNLLDAFYEKISERYYKIKEETEVTEELYEFFSEYNMNQSHTILVIEEPEAHLHPILQRSIYREVMSKEHSIVLTTHSSDIVSVSPVDSIVHLRSNVSSTEVSSSAKLAVSGKELADIQRYLDVKRSELFFGKGVILVEGIAEEYLIPVLAKECGINLDFHGIVCCNINSTNFKPYITLLKELKIPYVIFTDGDYYFVDEDGNRKYQVMAQEEHDNFGYLGLELAIDTLKELGITIDSEDFEEEELNRAGYYFSDYTLEVDLMILSENNTQMERIINESFSELTTGGDTQKANFLAKLKSGDYYYCLKRIEDSSNKIGKGRFAQRISTYEGLRVPKYIKDGLVDLVERTASDEN